MTALKIIDPRTDPLWRELAVTRGSAFSSPEWLTAIGDTYGFDMKANVLVDEKGGAQAGLAYVELDDFRGHRLISVPFCDYLDPFVGKDPVDQEREWNELVAPLVDSGLPFQLRVLDIDAPRRDPRFEQVGELAWHCTNLELELEEIFADMDRRVRQNVRTAIRNGVTMRFGSDLEDVRAFHDLHRHTRKYKHQLLAQPVTLFENIWKAFAPSGNITIGFAIHEGDVIAASFYLQWGDVWYFKFSASIFERLIVRPSEMMAWESMRLGRERGCHYYDWGVTDLEPPGLIAYKRKLRAEERRVSVMRHTPEGYTNPNGAEAGAVLGELTALLTRPDVPDEVTKRAGEILYRYFT